LPFWSAGVRADDGVAPKKVRAALSGSGSIAFAASRVVLQTEEEDAAVATGPTRTRDRGKMLRSEVVRAQAGRRVRLHPVRAAEALQLTAGLVGRPPPPSGEVTIYGGRLRKATPLGESNPARVDAGHKIPNVRKSSGWACIGFLHGRPASGDLAIRYCRWRAASPIIPPSGMRQMFVHESRNREDPLRLLPGPSPSMLILAGIAPPAPRQPKRRRGQRSESERAATGGDVSQRARQFPERTPTKITGLNSLGTHF
jgi:hypothetical protein